VRSERLRVGALFAVGDAAVLAGGPRADEKASSMLPPTERAGDTALLLSKAASAPGILRGARVRRVFVGLVALL
jgi:hypothetical protein